MWDYVTPALPWIGYLLLLALVVAGLFINILGLPGLWLIVVGVVCYAWATGFEYLGWWSIGIIIALGLLAELVEFVAGAAGSAQAGGSKRGMAGAIVGGIVGGIVGTPVFPIVGTIIGSIIGCALGAYLIETTIGKTHTEATSISIGAAKGRFVGLVAKSAFGVAMGLITAIVGLPINFGDDNSSVPPMIQTPTTSAAPTTAPATVPSTQPEPSIGS
jgi:uncharacterized protein YqgC (DUF456 family)